MKFSPKDMLIDLVLLFLVAGVALILSFTFTGSDASLGVLILYFLEPTILLCNFIPLFLLTLFFTSPWVARPAALRRFFSSSP